MKKNFIYKFLISFIVSVFLFSNVCFSEPTFVSLSPALTETMFAINAQSMLKGVSTACTYPEEAKKIDVSREYQLYFLIAHGILHLLGFDHQTEEDYNFVVEIQKRH